MARIDMSTKLWEIKLSAVKLNNIKYPLIEIYCDFGESVVGDTLNFGSTRDDYGPALRRKMMYIGNPNVMCAISSPTVSHERITDGALSILQTIGSVGGNSASFLQVIYNGNGITLNTHVSFAGLSNGTVFSPLVFIHNTYDNTVLLTEGAGGVDYTIFPSFYDGSTYLVMTENGIALGNVKSEVGGNGNQPFTFTCYSTVPYDEIITKYYPVTPDSDPWSPNNINGGVGGDGQPQTGDSITDPALPTISPVQTGFITLYKATVSELNSLATFMWGSMDLDIFKRVFSSPMDAILGLSILPAIVPSGSASNVILGNIDTGVSMAKISTQYVKLDMGSLTINKKWGAFLDYSPYTRAYLYLPFIGIRPIDIDAIMDKAVHVKYNIDVMSGACCAFVIVGSTTLYSYVGQCACSVPITGRDWTNVINGILGAVSNTTGAIASAAGGNLPGMVSGIASAAQSILNAKPQIEHSGAMGSMGGLMGIKRPFIIVERPVQAVPGHQNSVMGYPSFIYKHIGELTGYNVFENIHLEGIPCTSDELQEIEDILLKGVII